MRKLTLLFALLLCSLPSWGDQAIKNLTTTGTLTVTGVTNKAAVLTALGAQALNANLTAISALTTTSYGRSLLETASAATLRTLADAQQHSANLDILASTSTTSYGRSLLNAANAAALRTLAGTVIGTDVQAQDADLQAIAALSTTSYGRVLLEQGVATVQTYLGLLIGVDVLAPTGNGSGLAFNAGITVGTGGTTVTTILAASATLDFPLTVTVSTSDLTITVTGAAASDVVSLGVPNGSIVALGNYSAWVSAANTVTVRFTNFALTSLDPASGVFKVVVTKF